MGSEQHAAAVRPNPYVLGLDQIDATDAAVAGGKGASLGELARIDGVEVPPGFCVTTEAFRRATAQSASLEDRLDRLSRLDPEDHDAIRDASAEARRMLAATAVPQDVAAAVRRALAGVGERAAFAVRSSATGEDSATASFAGQHDTYLNVVGAAAILQHVSRCWASLFTERAVTYRLRNGIDHRAVAMAVVVQQMATPRAAGVLFTADPLTGHRRVARVEATRGLGEALVSGVVSPDTYEVRDGRVVGRTLAGPGEQPVLTDAQVVALVALGRRIEAHFGRPQDVEWCLTGDGVAIVQSRPITTLFPVPAAGDDAPHVYVSVGHQQMMTDPMKPLGLSLWQLTALPKMYEAGGRLFVDVAPRLASPASREALFEMLGTSDPLIGDALRTIAGRGDLVPSPPESDGAAAPPPAASAPAAPLETDPAIVTSLIARAETAVAALQDAIGTVSGPALFDVIRADIQDLKRTIFDPTSHQAIMAGMEATWWLNDRLAAWLGEQDAADTLTQSVPGNVTSEMGLALLDVADAIRPHPEVVAFLERVDDDDFLDELAEVAGGRQARDAIQAYLDRYGMRCVGEIDITRSRWSERPTALVPSILTNIKNFEPGAGPRRFEQGLREARAKEREVLERLRALPGGERKAQETTAMIDRVRTFSGYREYPKYHIVCRSFIYKLALLAEADHLVRDGVLREREDSFYLTFDELHDAVRTREVDAALVAERRQAFRAHEALTPPRVLTSDGEVVTGSYRRDDLPPGALIGLPVSAGTVEGRARVIRDMAGADVEPGDILVTAFTDPSWSPLFVAISGLVTEVGGLMTHGAVIAREYGLPAIVGVEHATRRIRDGDRIRVDGTRGSVEILAGATAPGTPRA
jgi:pyruvate,water dikinase